MLYFLKCTSISLLGLLLNKTVHLYKALCFLVVLYILGYSKKKTKKLFFNPSLYVKETPLSERQQEDSLSVQHEKRWIYGKISTLLSKFNVSNSCTTL